MSFDRDKYIIDNLKEKAEVVKNKGYNLFALFLQGSQNYELDIYSDEYKSDIDAKAIIIPSFDDIVLNRKPISTTLVLENNEHIELKDIRIMKEVIQTVAQHQDISIVLKQVKKIEMRD